MRKALAGALLVWFAGCGSGQEPASEPAAQPSFEAAVAVSPERPVVGRWMTLNIDMKNTSRAQVAADVELRVVDDSGALLYEQTWWEVPFTARENWSVTQGFQTGGDSGNKPYTVALKLRDPASGTPFYDNPKVTRFVISPSTR